MALNLILRCKFSQNLPTNDSLQKDQVKLLQPENCILPGFFEILPPRRHSLGQRDLKGCGILSFSPSLYIYICYKGTCLDMVMESLWDNYRMVVGVILGTVILGYLWSMIIQSEIRPNIPVSNHEKGSTLLLSLY